LLSVEDLRVAFAQERGEYLAVDGVSFSLAPGEALGIVGESGCGKSVTALALLRLVPDPPGRIAGGRVVFEGRDLLGLDERAMRAVRGGGIAMIFQEPATALNPVFTIGDQIMEVLRRKGGAARGQARARAVELLARVGIAEPQRRLDQYPHALSGGMRQRVMIAMALAGNPRLLIADEPTTALDVTIQAQILALLNELRRELGLAVILITHDLGVVAQFADRVMVMYAGRAVEEAATADLFARPSHPYTAMLMRSQPSIEGVSGRLPAIPGTVPSLADPPAGCRFHPRCPEMQPPCTAARPGWAAVASGHRAACIRVTERADAGG